MSGQSDVLRGPEACRDARSPALLEAAVRNLRFACRSLLRAPLAVSFDTGRLPAAFGTGRMIRLSRSRGHATTAALETS